MKTKRLGRGLNALIDTHETSDELQEIPVHEILPNPYQPRTDFSEEKMEELTQSIKEFGLIQPITVRKAEDEQGFQIAVGERRWRAAKRANLETVPALVQEMDEQKMMELAMVENLQREDLNPMEEAKAYQHLMKSFNFTQENLSLRLGRSRSSLANSLRLLNLSPLVQEYVSRETISKGHARALLGLKDHREQESLVKRIIQDDLSVRETEELVKFSNSPREKMREKKRITSYLNYEKEMKDLLSVPVHIHEGRRKNRIVIEFTSEDDLKQIIGKFNRE